MNKKARARISPSAGFTLTEMLLALALGTLVFLGVGVAYKSSAEAYLKASARLPLVRAQANMTTLLRQKAGSATCITEPAEGKNSNVLIGRSGVYCGKSGTIAIDGAPQQYFIFCIDASQRLMFRQGSVPAPASLSQCKPETDPAGWRVLSVGVEASPADPPKGAFERSAGLNNQVIVGLKFSPPAEQAQQGAAQEDPVFWRSAITIQSPLEVP